ncbi:uncharacterized protein LOC122330037 isoform X2 [Puntigrus tetrazona]|uniref:uncharacterized protein LOC122330037 isoform X2 n=1 Tax=Puntigrus tetrazona TaxID=1606681 RepID=UPI001C88FD3F|nr:uncharacterized protein LOC122330037 isoform X2 [Puntigrus tetrazona]
METPRVLVRSLTVVVVIASVFWTTTAAAEGQKPDAHNCCKKLSSALVNDPIISFRLQRESLPCVKAVILETERGDFCIDPRQRWVQEKVKQFLRSQRNKPQTTPTSSTDKVVF